MTQPQHLRRFLVFREATSRQFLCVAAARDAKHALRIARQHFRLTKSAKAILERP